MFLVLLFFFPYLGLVTDLDGDGVVTAKDCDDSEPAARVEWCFDSNSNGSADDSCVQPVANQCLEPSAVPVDSRFVVCNCLIIGRRP